MTAQITDTFLYKGDTYSLIGIIGSSLASLEQFGMKPMMINTACYRGYYATYELNNKRLYLREFTLRTKNGEYLPIEKKEPSIGDYQATYYNLKIEIYFTGKIRLAKNFIEELYIHMGYQKAIAFNTVLDIILKNGHLTVIKDRSPDIEQKRQSLRKNGVNIFKALNNHSPSIWDLEW